VLRETRPQVLRYYLLASHYRSAIEYGADRLTESAAAYEKLERFVLRNGKLSDRGSDGASDDDPQWQAFAEAMNDDLATPRALAVVHEVVAAGFVAADPSREYALARRMLTTLGLDPVSQWPSADGGNLQGVVDHLVAGALERRAQARREKDWAASDAIRDELAAAGITVEDTPQGQRWELAR
jgi:cysteinyl-tRNA synthetase